jgi:hypothetical protein
MLSHAQRHMVVESSRRKIVRKSGVALGPVVFLTSQYLKPRRPARVELFEKSQCVGQIRELIHEVDLSEKGVPHVSKLRFVPQPSGKLLAPGCGDLVNDASRAALGGSAARSQQLLLLQPLQDWIDLAQFGSPEMTDTVVEDGLQVVSAARLPQETKQNMFETHDRHYITVYITVNCFLTELCSGIEPRNTTGLRLCNGRAADS